MEFGEVLKAMFTKIASWFTTIYGYIKDYALEFAKDPQKFLMDHTIIVILALFLVIFIFVLFFNIIRNIQDRRAVKKRVLAKYLEDEKKAQERIAKEEKVEVKNDEEEFERIIEEINNVTPNSNTNEVKVEIPQVEEITEIVETPKEEKEEIKGYVIPEETREEFYVDKRRPIYQNTVKEEPIIPDIEEEILDIKLEEKNQDKKEDDTKGEEPVTFDPIPELRVLDKKNEDTMEEIISSEPEPIKMEKIEVIKINTVKKFGPENFDTNRQGKTFTYDELSELIKD